MELVSSAIIEPVVNLLTNHITQKLRNLTSSADRVKDMKEKMKVLDGQRIDNENHLRRNRGNNKEVPARVEGWLEEVENIKKEVEKIPSNDIGCFNVKTKYRAGKNALAHIKAIDRLITEEITWTDAVIPLGRVDSKRPTSTSASGGEDQNGFDSRKKIFNDALKLLQEDDDHTARVIALCGMGGVGKTTLMKQLKKAAEDNKMFKWILVAVIGNTPNLFTIQNAIAAHIGEPLTETDETLRASLLSKRFQAFSERKEKSLVILDDVWEKIKLEDIGLASPLPNGVKLLLTSRNVQVCRQIADDPAFEEVKVDVLKENEAQDFFCQKAGISADHVYYEIGCEIVKKCGCLPLAIELIAGTLKGEENRNVWRHSLKCLKNNDLNKNLQEIMEMSYNNLKQEQDKAIFLLCGLFPEDSNIPIEDLTRYAWGLKEAWGLKLLSKVHTIEDARDSTQTSVSNLKKAYLLMDGDSHHSDCVKLHDLVLAFVVATVSNGGEDECWIIHHKDDFSNWSEANSMSQPCKQISLACKGMSEFPSEFLYPNLSLLKLMHGNESLRFPPGFYEGMEQLQVIAFEKFEYPLIPTPVQFSSNLRTLCLRECSLMFDLACIGNLSNLEVLSFADSGITILPSTFRNLKKLRLLDVTGCCNLVIDDGVLKSLVKLEELYMIPYDKKACCFTDNNSREFAELSENLKRFKLKLSMGSSFTEVREHVQTYKVDMHSYENSLKLVTNIEELLKSKINELFKITDALYLQVNDMNALPCSSFFNLRLLVVSECAELKYLFTLNVAKNLSKLENLTISRCLSMEAAIHTENNGSSIILFPNLKYLRLAKLPNLLCFCNKFNVIELPCLMELQLEGLQNFTSIYPSNASSSVLSNISRVLSFFHKEDATPKLEKLVVSDMENLKEIWPPQFSSSNVRMLKELRVDDCAELKYLFTLNVATNLSELEYLQISGCGAMGAVIHTENNGSDIIMFSNLKCLRLARLQQLLCFCNNINVIELPCLMELQLEGLPKITSIYHDSATSFVSSNISPTQSFLNKEDATPKLEKLFVKDCDSIEVLFNMDFGEIEQLSTSLRSIKVDGCNSLVKLFSCNPFPFFNNLLELEIRRCRSIQVLFDIDWGRTSNIGEQVCTSNLRSIKVRECDKLVKLFSCSPFPFINNLQELEVRSCRSIQVLFEIDSGCAGRYEGQDAAPKLEKLVVSDMENLKEIWPPQFSVSNLYPLRELTVEGCGSIKVLFNMDFGEIKQQLSSSLRSIKVSGCDSLVKLFSCNPFPFLNSLQDLNVKSCDSIQVLFDIDSGRTSNIGEQVCTSSLRSIVVKECDSLVNLLPSNPMPLFNHLEQLYVSQCDSVEVIFDIDMGCVGEMDEVSSSRLRSIELEKLRKLREVWRIKDGGNNNLIHGFEAVERIYIKYCKRFENLITPATTNLNIRALKQVEINGCGRERERNYELVEKEKEISKIAFPSSLLPTFHHLHKLVLWDYKDVEVVFEIRTPSSIESPHNIQQQQLIILPYLEELQLDFMGRMSHVWKCNWNELILQKQPSQSSFHNLTTISMYKCHSIKYLFSPLMAKLLSNLKNVCISSCDGIEEIVSNRDDEDASIYSYTTTSDVVVFPHLKSLSLVDLPNFVGFFLGKNEFIWPALQNVVIIRCPQITVFTYGQSTTPELKFINTSLGKHSVECGLNFHVTTTSHQARLPVYESTSSYSRLPWSYQNLIEANMSYYKPSGGQTLFSSDEVSQLQKLETVHCWGLDIEEIFDSEIVAEIPNLRQVYLWRLDSLKYIWKSKQGTVLKFPNLTRLSIHECHSLEYVFTCPMVGSLLQLQELHIKSCDSMKVIVKGEEEEECDAIVNASVVFPCLKLLRLDSLYSLEGFCIGKEAFEFPSLDTLQIDFCPEMRVFTKGDLFAPKLYAITIKWGWKKYNIHNRLNSVIENFTKR